MTAGASNEDDYLSWEAFRDRVANSARSGEGRTAGTWAVDVLAGQLGPRWLSGAEGREGSVPQEILLAEFHAVAFGELLDLALRLHLLAGLPGMGDVRRELRNDLRLERRMHTRALLGTAALAQRHGWRAALEARLGPGLAPTDVVLQTPSGSLAVEVFAVLTDDLMRAGMEDADALSARVRAICWSHHVELDGHFEGGCVEENEAWLAEVEYAAAAVEQDGRPRTVAQPAGQVEVLSRAEAFTRETSFTGPVMVGKGPPRLAGILRKKAVQAVGAGATWMRVDVLDGLWQFTDWAGLRLPEKGEALAAEVRSALSGIDGIRGAVLSCGPAMAQGTFVGESARLVGGGFAIRRTFEPMRVRETIVIPMSPGGDVEAAAWAALYDEEADWLDWALRGVGLPPASLVLGRESPSGG